MLSALFISQNASELKEVKGLFGVRACRSGPGFTGPIACEPVGRRYMVVESVGARRSPPGSQEVKERKRRPGSWGPLQEHAACDGETSNSPPLKDTISSP